jgi:Arc/MetJ-type ribon-helix-helix transcriptional regulator
MPRTNVWLNDDQVKQLQRELGKGVNISGCIRAGLAMLLDTLQPPDQRARRRATALLGELDTLINRAESQLTPAAVRKVKHGVKP